MARLMLFILVLFPFFSYAEIEESPEANIIKFQGYTEYGGGDVIFRLSSPAATCKGYWLTKNHPGFETVMSMLIASFYSKNEIRAYGHTETSNKWGGSGTHFCKLYTIKLKD